MAVLSLPPHLQLALGTRKDAFPIRCNDRQVGGGGRLTTVDIEALRTGTRF